MDKRNPYADFGLAIAVGVFICLLIKSLLFGFSWGSIIGLALSVAYFFFSWKYDSQSIIVKHVTTAFLLIAALGAVSMVLFDKNARPKMHAFEGTGDTIQDRKYEEENPMVTMYETLPEQATDTATTEEDLDSTLLEGVIEEGISIDEDDYNSATDTIPTIE